MHMMSNLSGSGGTFLVNGLVFGGCCWVFVCVFCFVFYYASGSMILSLTGVHDHRADIERNRTVNYLVEQTRNVDVTCFDTTRVAILLKEENMSLRCVTCD